MASMKAAWNVFKKLKIELQHNLVIYLEYKQNTVSAPVLIDALFTIVRLYEQLKCLLNDE